MVFVVKCRFLVILNGKLHPFALVNSIKNFEQIKECSELEQVVKSACLYLSLLKLDTLPNISGNEGHVNGANFTFFISLSNSPHCEHQSSKNR